MLSLHTTSYCQFTYDIPQDPAEGIWREDVPTWTGMNKEHNNSREADDNGQVNNVDPQASLLTDVVLKHSNCHGNLLLNLRSPRDCGSVVPSCRRAVVPFAPVVLP